jgi:hypothetical protein
MRCQIWGDLVGFEPALITLVAFATCPLSGGTKEDLSKTGVT